jgi:two-component system cell cycle response regulator
MLIDHQQKNIDALKQLVLGAGHSVVEVSSRDKMTEVLEDTVFDVALINTGTDFIERDNVCTRVRMSDANRDSAVIFIAQEYDIEELSVCFDSGGNDYIAKPVNPDELLKRIAMHGGMKQKIDEMRHRSEKLASIATIDPLTKISSRIHMQTLVQQQIQLFNRYGEPVTLIYMRILELNKVNALVGYTKGDQLILRFVKAVKEVIRSSDSFGRWIGGDFVLMLPKTDAPSAKVVAKKLNTELVRDDVFAKYSLRFGFGITEVMSEDTPTGAVERSRSALQKIEDHEYERIAVH